MLTTIDFRATDTPRIGRGPLGPTQSSPRQWEPAPALPARHSPDWWVWAVECGPGLNPRPSLLRRLWFAITTR